MNETVQYNIGEVKVTTDKGNPYTAGKRGTELYTEDRIEAFRKLWKGDPTDGLFFWMVPFGGGAKLLEDPRNQIRDLEYWMTR
jgi:hypothetical protein